MSISAQHSRDVAIIRNRRAAEIEQAKSDWRDIQPRCAELGINVTYTMKGLRGVRGTHFKLWRETWAVGDYWPTTGLVRIADGRTLAAESLADALEKVAVAVGPPKPGPRQHGPRPKGECKRKHRPRPEGTADRPYPAQQRNKPAKHDPRKSDFPDGDVKILRTMITAKISRCRKDRPTITDGDVRAVLYEIAASVGQKKGIVAK